MKSEYDKSFAVVDGTRAGSILTKGGQIANPVTKPGVLGALTDWRANARQRRAAHEVGTAFAQGAAKQQIAINDELLEAKALVMRTEIERDSAAQLGELFSELNQLTADTNDRLRNENHRRTIAMMTALQTETGDLAELSANGSMPEELIAQMQRFFEQDTVAAVKRDRLRIERSQAAIERITQRVMVHVSGETDSDPIN